MTAPTRAAPQRAKRRWLRLLRSARRLIARRARQLDAIVAGVRIEASRLAIRATTLAAAFADWVRGFLTDPDGLPRSMFNVVVAACGLTAAFVGVGELLARLAYVTAVSAVGVVIIVVIVTGLTEHIREGCNHLVHSARNVARHLRELMAKLFG